MKKIKVTYPLLFVLVNIFGLGIATFLWYSTLSIKVIGCLTGGCETVLSSPFAKIFGVPISAWGFAFYGVGLLFSLIRMVDDRPIIRLLTWALGSGSVFASVYFFYLEVVKIHAICFWCKFSTATTIILLLLTIFEIKKRGGLSAVYEDLKTLYKG